MTQRAWGWENRLRELIESKRLSPFAWGSNDCVRFAIESYVAMMGEEPPNMPSWNNLRSAVERLQEKPLEEWLTGMFGPPVFGFALARRGDVVTVPGAGYEAGIPADTPCAGVSTGPSIAVIGSGPTFAGGVVFLPLYQGLSTWRIGD